MKKKNKKTAKSPAKNEISTLVDEISNQLVLNAATVVVDQMVAFCQTKGISPIDKIRCLKDFSLTMQRGMRDSQAL